MSSKIGNARVSADDRSNTVQEERLRGVGCSIIRKEKASGGPRFIRERQAAGIAKGKAGRRLSRKEVHH